MEVIPGDPAGLALQLGHAGVVPLLVVLPHVRVQEVEAEVQVDEAVEGVHHVYGPEFVLVAGEVKLLHPHSLQQQMSFLGRKVVIIG